MTLYALCARNREKQMLASLSCQPDRVGSADSADTSFDVGVSIGKNALADVILAELAAYGVTAMAVAVTEDGQPVWSQGFGILTTDGSEAVRADSLLWVASLTKPITAIATLQQVEQGCLQLDVPVSAYMGFDMSQQPGMSDSPWLGTP